MQEVQVKEVARNRIYTLPERDPGTAAGGEHAFDDGGCVSAGITI